MKYTFVIASLIFTASLFGQSFTQKDCVSYDKYDKYVRVKNIYEDQFGFIWFSRGDGLYRYDGKAMEYINPTADPSSPRSYLLGNVYQRENQDYWFINGAYGFTIYHSKTNDFTQIRNFQYKGKQYSLNLRNIIYVAEKKCFFLSGMNGVWKVDTLGQVQGLYKPTDYHTNFFRNRHNPNETRTLTYDAKRDILWLGTHSGLYSVRFKNKDKLLRHPTQFKIPTNVVTHPYRDYYLINDLQLKGDQLYMAAWSGGLMQFDIDTEKWTLHTLKQDKGKLITTGGESLLEITDNQWIIINGNANVGSKVTGQPFLNQPLVDGKPIEQGNGVLMDRLGYIWITHFRKICKYQLNSQLLTPHTAQMYLHAIHVDSLLQSTALAHWDNQTLNIPATAKDIKFTFRAIHPISYDPIKYEYRLEGFEENWRQNDTAETAIYTQLSGGIYQFQARYWDSLSNKYIYTGKATLTVAYQDKTVFYLICALIASILLSIIGLLGYRYITKRRNSLATQRYETQLREVQDAALRSQMNPHFLFNSLNSIRYFIVTNDNIKAANYLTKFSRLIRLILENSRQKLVTLSEELELLRLYIKMEQIRFEDKFDFKIELSKDISPHKLNLPPMLIQPYIENAILHGINPKVGKGSIIITIKKENVQLIITIQDNGIGRKAAQAQKVTSLLKKKSLGMNITQTRLNLMTASSQKANIEVTDLYDEQKNAIGTKIILQLPLLNTNRNIL